MRGGWARLGCAAVAVAVGCGGTAIVDNNGAGGGGGSQVTSAASTSSGAGGTADVAVASAVATTVTTGGSACLTCSQALDGQDGESFCPGSQEKLTTLVECICGPRHNCETTCAPACDGAEPDEPCFDCIVNSCGEELDACLDDG